ncbi:hypothetical protein ACLH6Q_000001 [Campylobacter fetus]|uniref:hypothetical protein n=1 Tax=Campylobacter fetus TaxID=196 RepID=UPI0008188631|nr:hypothetical protein [Campylobacter fetus]EAH8299671.1 hypothetical protein [Campylobacter fetus]EAI7232270.1 hypothetical protein [Campylobacter fetus]EAK0428214.1 hypothetical protein [Campylobacter fetus]EAK5303889.1 hypothetical protein [Campylobacter fetus]EAM0408613.1 hypothetical protein [Campylobacter fetus]
MKNIFLICMILVGLTSFAYAKNSVTATFIGKNSSLSLELSGININYNFVGNPAIPDSNSDGILSKYAKSLSFSVNSQESNAKELLKLISKNDKVDLVIKTEVNGISSTYKIKDIKAYDFSAAYSNYEDYENNTTSPLLSNIYFSFYYENLELDGVNLVK